MSKFDTNGGYFAPKDYLKVNEGGSHEENPNGGVQIGVDPEGTPNLLEEGEPVYKDYVYSDNISAEKEFLEQNHLPSKYNGKLYSKIADDILTEAEERPLDPISRNGLEALLGRLADAQEGQKQAQQQRELEDELASLSPEELDQLEQMLAQEEQAQMAPEQMPIEAASEEQMMGPAEQMPAEGMPMMANGGPFRRNKNLTERMVESVREDAGLMSEKEKRYVARKKLQDKIERFWAPPTPEEITNVQDEIKKSIEESARKRDERQRKYEDSKFYRKLNELDDKYLDNMWLHPYYEREAPQFPIFKKFDIGGPLTEEQKQAIIDAGPIISRQKRTMADEVKDAILAQAKIRDMYSGRPQDPPLIDEHPGLDIAIMATHPGGVVSKLLAPSMYRGVANGLANGEGAMALMYGLAPEAGFLEQLGFLGKAKYSREFSKDFYRGVHWDKVRELKGSLESADDAIAGIRKNMAEAKASNNRDLLRNLESDLQTQEFTRRRLLDNFESEFRAARESEPIAAAKTQSGKSKSTPESAPASEPTPAPQSVEAEKPNRWRSGLYGAATGASMAGGYTLGNYLYNGLQDYKAADDFSDTGSDLDDIFSSTKTDKKESSDLISLKYGGPMKKFVGGGDIDEPIDPNELVSSPANGWSFWMPTTPVYNVPGFRAPVQRMDEYLYDKYGFNLTSPLTSSGNPVPSSSAPSSLSSTIPYNRSLNGEDFEAQEYYKNFLAHMLGIRDSEEANQWMQYIQDEIAKRNSNYQLKGFDDWYRLATDKKVGPVHQATEAVANELARRRQMRADKIAYEDAFKDVKAPNTVSLGEPVTGLRGMPTAVGQGNNLTSTNSVAAKNSDTLYGGEIAPARVAGENEEEQTPGLLPTWPRYAGAVGSGLLGLYNVFQQPDRYRAQRLNPATPTGRIHLQNQVYNPVDQNMVANAQIAQGNATNRALRNSGLGPSSAAAILAADNNTTGNLGTGFLQTWDANNQRRNAVIAANNQAEAQRAHFDYTVDAARAQALNDAAIRNAQNDLMIQRLNNMAEGEKYQAISNQISNGLQALSNIGKENFAMNQINTNPAFLGYGVGANGGMYYNPLTGKYERIEPISNPVPAKSTAASTAQHPVLKSYPRDYQLELLRNPTLYPGYDMTLNGLKKKKS